MKRKQRAAALVEFALAWPVALLIVLASVQAAVWAAEAYAASAATVAGARAGTVAAGSARIAEIVTLRSLGSDLIGVVPEAWCPGASPMPPPVWVCALDLGTSIEVDVGGTVPALVPIAPGGGLPLRAHLVLGKEGFRP